MIDRFFAKVEKTDSCWIWKGSRATGRFDYGTFRVGRKVQKAHRVSWELANGPIPDGMLVLHKCDVYACVNPEHLFIGTQLDNVHDMLRKNRANPPVGERNISHKRPDLRRGERSGNAKLKEAQVREIRVSTEFQRIIADRYGVCYQLIGAIKRREAWAHLT